MVLGSEIRDPEKTYSVSRIPEQGSKRHRIPDPDPQHCFKRWSRDLFTKFYHDQHSARRLKNLKRLGV
jgi:hypothetical protein